jgi:hypothetical protein
MTIGEMLRLAKEIDPTMGLWIHVAGLLMLLDLETGRPMPPWTDVNGKPVPPYIDAATSR